MKLENIIEEEEGEGQTIWLPETPTESMEFLSRSWSVSATELSKALSYNGLVPTVNLVDDDDNSDVDEKPPLIMLISNSSDKDKEDGSSAPTIKESYYHYSTTEATAGTESPPVSPRKSDDSKELLFLLRQGLNQDLLLSNHQLLRINGIYKNTMMKGRTMGRWLKDQKEKKKQEHRTLNAHLHAAISVAALAAAVAAIADDNNKDNKGSSISKTTTSSAMASAAALVASHCIEIAEEMGADHAHILSVVSSAVNAKTNGDIMALTAAAATALRGAATLKARLEKGIHGHGHGSGSATMPVALGSCHDQEQIISTDETKETSFLTALNFVSKGGELLKRTRKGDLHWKNVSININSKLQVVAKMKSKHMAGTFTKKKKYVLSDTCSDIGAWIGRDIEVEERRAYFGMKTAADRVIEFECRNKGEKQMWLDGIQYMLHCKASMA